MSYWSRDQQEHQINMMKAQVWTQRDVVPDDTHIGKRVFCLSFILEQQMIYGTIEQVLRCSNEQFQAVVCWRVRTDEGMILEEPANHFALYGYPTEFKAGDRVRYLLDEGGYWEGVVLKAVLTPGGMLHILIHIQPPQNHGAVPLTREISLASHPDRLSLCDERTSSD